MNYINQMKAGAKVAPAFSIILYCLFVASDIYTTYLASPDLKYEGNWVIRYFSLSWSQIIIKDSLTVLFFICGLLLSINYILSYYKENINRENYFILEVFQKKKLFLSIIVITFFYSHLLYSAFLTINNYLHFVYISDMESPVTKISVWYINKIMMVYPNIFIWYRGFFIIVALSFTIFKVRQLKDKYLPISK
jgi:hypothetical protein